MTSGPSTYSFNINTLAWSPGPKDLTVALSVYDSVIASTTISLPVNGIGLQASMDRDVYYPVGQGVLLWSRSSMI